MRIRRLGRGRRTGSEPGQLESSDAGPGDHGRVFRRTSHRLDRETSLACLGTDGSISPSPTTLAPIREMLNYVFTLTEDKLQ
jgi:hypothetical protein